jgi:sterol desaturase/sphingolipid hydroxylase (fatty acid hydroxylase superfamily)
MTGWLLQHQSLLFYLWLGAFGLVALCESFVPLRQPETGTAARWGTNLGLAALDMVVGRICVPFTGVATALWAEQGGFGVLNQLAVPFWLACVASVAALDLGNYTGHRLFHVVPVLWRCHKIHHSDLEVDCSTALRHHPFEYLVIVAITLALIAALGAPPLAVMAWATLDLVMAAFNHGNVTLPPTAERALRAVLVTPDMHRIHHSAQAIESNRNFANVFSWWDRIFASYQREPELGHPRMNLGLAELRTADEVTLVKLLALPFRSSRMIASA